MFKNEIFAKGNSKYLRNVFWKLIEIAQGDDFITKLFFTDGFYALRRCCAIYVFFKYR